MFPWIIGPMRNATFFAFALAALVGCSDDAATVTDAATDTPSTDVARDGNTADAPGDTGSTDAGSTDTGATDVATDTARSDATVSDVPTDALADAAADGARLDGASDASSTDAATDAGSADVTSDAAADAMGNCGAMNCAASQVCVRTVATGGACRRVMKGEECGPSERRAGDCCVYYSETFACAARPSGCSAELTCSCAGSLCAGPCPCGSVTGSQLTCQCFLP